MKTIKSEVARFEVFEKAREWEATLKDQIIEAKVNLGKPTSGVRGSVTGKVTAVNKYKVTFHTVAPATFFVSKHNLTLDVGEEFKISRLGTPGFSMDNRLKYPTFEIDKNIHDFGRIYMEYPELAAVARDYVSQLSDEFGELHSTVCQIYHKTALDDAMITFLAEFNPARTASNSLSRYHSIKIIAGNSGLKMYLGNTECDLADPEVLNNVKTALKGHKPLAYFAADA